MPQYYFCLLRPDLSPANAENNRKDHAAYEGAPGGLIVRGENLGELEGRPWRSHNLSDGIDWKNGGVAGQLIKEQINPLLTDAIAKHEKEIRAYCLQKIKDNFAARLAEARKRLDECEQKAAQMVKALEKKK